jgi:AAA15 family ATPase/GTPase
MYIKSMVIDGFKSYGHRTEINGFDPAFNAITGLNGSGKSNILDSICFLMGITNLSHVSTICHNNVLSKDLSTFFLTSKPFCQKVLGTCLGKRINIMVAPQNES